MLIASPLDAFLYARAYVFPRAMLIWPSVAVFDGIAYAAHIGIGKGLILGMMASILTLIFVYVGYFKHIHDNLPDRKEIDRKMPAALIFLLFLVLLVLKYWFGYATMNTNLYPGFCFVLNIAVTLFCASLYIAISTRLVMRKLR